MTGISELPVLFLKVLCRILSGCLYTQTEAKQTFCAAGMPQVVTLPCGFHHHHLALGEGGRGIALVHFQDGE